MTTSQVLLADWIDLVDALLRAPSGSFPHLRVRDELSATFDTVAAWSWVDADFNCGFEMVDQPAGWPTPDEQQVWRDEAMADHPLMHWFLLTGDHTAMTVGRVPSAVGTRRGRQMLTSFLRPVGLEEQLVMPFAGAGGQELQSFTLATSGTDYADEQLDLARRIQPMLILLARQHQVLAGRPASHRDAADVGLTGREQAVLCLLSQGLTAVAIGHQLGIATGTVRKHLENLYRKLDVNDRVRAVTRAHELGLVDLVPAET